MVGLSPQFNTDCKLQETNYCERKDYIPEPTVQNITVNLNQKLDYKWNYTENPLKITLEITVQNTETKTELFQTNTYTSRDSTD